MPTHVAFLRGLNLGRRRLTNDALAGHFADAGFPDATPYQASGNVVFTPTGSDAPDALEQLVAAALEDALGYPVDTFVRTLAQVDGIASAPPLLLAGDDGFKVHVLFLHDPPAPAVLDHLATLETPDDRFLAGPDAPRPDDPREMAWLRRGRLSDSTIDASDPDALTGGRTATMRTLGTLQRIVKKFG